MNTLAKIRETGQRVAAEYGVYEQPQIEEISLPNELIEDFVERLVIDFAEFSTLEVYSDYFNLFNRAFMYVYGKGAEFAYFTRIGKDFDRISYNFDKAMQGTCGENLPNNVRFRINQRASAMLEMYVQTFEHTRGPQDIIISEGLSFNHCIHTILCGAFFYGAYVCSTVPLDEKDYISNHEEPKEDKPYDYDNYDKKYKPEDYKMMNVRFGDFNEIKDKLGLS